MIGKPVALIQVPNQRLFGMRAAARYLGIHEQTLRKLADENTLVARQLGVHRVFLLEELDRFIEGLPAWYSATRDENPRRSKE
jgi:excisionase family DNA binding protein